MGRRPLPVRAGLIVPVLFLSAFPRVLAPAGRAQEGWRVYVNERYGYEIRYPDTHDLWPTGPEGERDGRSIRVAIKEFQAPRPILDLRVFPPPDMPEGKEAPGPDLARDDEPVIIGGIAGRLLTYRWKKTGAVSLVRVVLPGAMFTYQPPVGARDVRGSVWWKIIESFRWIPKR